MRILKPERAEGLMRFLNRYNLPMQNLDLLDRALTHSSYAFEHQLPYDNERLEFLGDAVLGLVVSEYLYHEFPRAREGVLSKYKATIVSRPVLGKRAQEMGIGDLILLGKGEENAGARERPTLLGSALEAVVGALYLELGITGIKRWLVREVFEPGRQMSHTDEYSDFKSLLQEWAQKNFQTVPEYEVVSESGPDHSKTFEVVVRVNGEVLGHGEGPRKKIAENQAAMRAYWKVTHANGGGVPPVDFPNFLNKSTPNDPEDTPRADVGN
ncbi:MAG: ribonuclease III [Candidatus Sumerlaea chitinivorans]|nr:ribonuclease III [Candidatus Sumerlaea chitinivorans]